VPDTLLILYSCEVNNPYNHSEIGILPGWAWWHMPVIPALGKQRQEDQRPFHVIQMKKAGNTKNK
jgi:hypothetical protein